MNKKAQIGESLQDIAGIVIIILLLIIFFILSVTVFRGAGHEIKKFSDEQNIINQEHLSLKSWLEKTLTIENESITAAQLIILSKINEKYRIILEKEIDEAFYGKYDLEILSKEEMITTGWQIFPAGITFIFLPYAKEKGTFFYIPANETIVIALRKK